MNVRIHDTDLDETRSYWGVTDFQVEGDSVRLFVPPSANCGLDEIDVTGTVESAQSQTTLDDQTLDEAIEHDKHNNNLLVIIESATYPRLYEY